MGFMWCSNASSGAFPSSIDPAPLTVIVIAIVLLVILLVVIVLVVTRQAAAVAILDII